MAEGEVQLKWGEREACRREWQVEERVLRLGTAWQRLKRRMVKKRVVGWRALAIGLICISIETEMLDPVAEVIVGARAAVIAV